MTTADGGAGITISQTPTVTAGAYSAGDAAGGLLTFANAARESGAVVAAVKESLVCKGVCNAADSGNISRYSLWSQTRVTEP